MHRLFSIQKTSTEFKFDVFVSYSCVMRTDLGNHEQIVKLLSIDDRSQQIGW